MAADLETATDQELIDEWMKRRDDKRGEVAWAFKHQDTGNYNAVVGMAVQYVWVQQHNGTMPKNS